MINLISKINIYSENHYHKTICLDKNNNKKLIFFYLNSHVFYEANNDSFFKQTILNCNYLIADGYSIVWAYKKLLKIEIEKVVFTYSYLKSLRDCFIRNEKSIFFLGASKKNIIKAIKNERENFPKLKIVGYHHGYFDKNTETKKIISTINNSKTDILIVGMGCPLSEEWIMKNKNLLNPSLIFSVGGFFDFLAKDKIIAPKWMYNSGLEWIFRLIQEPKRLFRRYLFANSYLLYSIIKIKHAIKKN